MEDAILTVKNRFSPYRDKEKAIGMSRYMRNQFPFLGLNSPQLEKLSRALFKAEVLPSGSDLPAFITALWELDEREYQYFAMNYFSRNWKSCAASAPGLLEYTITHKSWWDTVDFLASHIAGAIFRQDWDLAVVRSRQWVESQHLWLQRSALLFQLKYKENTDKDLLFDYILRLRAEPDFFIRKAIGWSLREYSKVNGKAVVEFTASAGLSGLSEREALKWLKKKGKLN